MTQQRLHADFSFLAPQGGTGLTPAQLILRRVAQRYARSVPELKTPLRHRSIENARAGFMAAYALRQAGLTLNVIGRALGGRDHTTVLYRVNRFKKTASDDDLKFVEHMLGEVTFEVGQRREMLADYELVRGAVCAVVLRTVPAHEQGWQQITEQLVCTVMAARGWPLDWIGEMRGVSEFVVKQRVKLMHKAADPLRMGMIKDAETALGMAPHLRRETAVAG